MMMSIDGSCNCIQLDSGAYKILVYFGDEISHIDSTYPWLLEENNNNISEMNAAIVCVRIVYVCARI